MSWQIETKASARIRVVIVLWETTMTIAASIAATLATSQRSVAAANMPAVVSARERIRRSYTKL